MILVEGSVVNTHYYYSNLNWRTVSHDNVRQIKLLL